MAEEISIQEVLREHLQRLQEAFQWALRQKTAVGHQAWLRTRYQAIQAVDQELPSEIDADVCGKLFYENELAAKANITTRSVRNRFHPLAVRGRRTLYAAKDAASAPPCRRPAQDPTPEQIEQFKASILAERPRL